MKTETERKPYAFGVDVGGTTVKLGLFRTDGTLLEVWQIPTRTEENGKNILPDIAAEIKAMLQRKQIPAEEVEGIGLDVPGPVNAEGTVFKCINLGWGTFNVVSALQDLTGFRVKAGNDANVAALGELWMGGGKGFQSIVMITLGTGVGGGVVTEDGIISGFHGAAGEVGHITVNEEETECCGCGKKGCLEQYTSAKGVATQMKRYLQLHPEVDSSLRQMKDFTAQEIFNEAKAGDAAALAVVDRTCALLGKAATTIACVVDPEAFVIGGGMSAAGDFLLDKMEASYRKYAFHASRDTAFRLCDLGNHAGIYGAVKMLL